MKTCIMNVQHAGTVVVQRMVLLMAAGMVIAGTTFAGDLYPSGPPAPTMKSLQDIYDQAAQTYRAVRGGDSLLFFPYLLERPGTVNTTQYTFDSTIYLVWTGPLVGQGLKSGKASNGGKEAPNVTVNLYLYTNAGEPASYFGNPVANPASFVLSPDTPKATISLETLFLNAGGFPAAVYVGYGILSISSGDWNDVSVEARIVNAHTGPGDVSITPLNPVRIQNRQSMGAPKTDEPSSDNPASTEAGK